MNKKYELMVVLDPDLKPEEQEKIITKIKDGVSDAKGKITSSKDFGKKHLAYLISKKSEGFYWFFELEIPAQNAPSFRQKIQMEEKIIRYLLTTISR